MSKILFSLSLCLFIAISLFSTIINIPDDYLLIQQGIDASADGDTVLVQPGTYFENINYNGHNIVVGSLFLTTQDSSYIEQTTINGSQNGSVVTFENGEDSTAVLAGFTITNGSGSLLIGYGYLGGGGICCYQSSPKLDYLIIENNNAVDGGGIVCYSYSNPKISDCIIFGNVASGYDGDGGGINLKHSNPIIQNTKINNNYANDNGGGITCSWSSPILKNVLITNNHANDKAGGLSCGNDSEPLLIKVLFAYNSANDKGGSIYCAARGNLVIINSTITGNHSPWSSIYADNSGLTILNSIIYNDVCPQEIIASTGSLMYITYSDIQGGWEGEGNINENPLFVDPMNGDFHLQENSPCIDAGDPTSPLDPDGTIADMGAYYFHQGDLINADFSGNPLSGILPLEVQFTDLSTSNIMEWEWDFNNDGVIDSYLQNPCYSFIESGLYTVALTVSDGIDEDTEIKTDYINVSDSLLADFEASPSNGVVPLVVQFIDLSSGNIIGWMWDFENDGVIDSNEQNPLYIYEQTGNYDVALTITDGFDEDIEIKLNYITVVDTTNLNNNIYSINTKLNQNYPNPFNPSTTIYFTADYAENTELFIYNIKGQKIKTLINKNIQPGEHAIVWDGTDIDGKPVASGLYFYKLKTGDYKKVRKMLLLK